MKGYVSLTPSKNRTTKTFECGYCSLKFKSKEELDVHMTEKHYEKTIKVKQ